MTTMADCSRKDDDDDDYDYDDDDFFEQAQRRRRQCFNCCATFEDVADDDDVDDDDDDELRHLCPRCVTFRHCTGCKRRLPNSCFSTTANDDHTYHRVLCRVCSRVNNLLVMNDLN